MQKRMASTGIIILGALTASLIAFAPPALAASCGGGQGQALLLGCSYNTATDSTIVWSTVNVYGGSYGVTSHGSAYGLYGQGTISGATGVYGEGDGNGVWGYSQVGTGVYGNTDASGAQNGVYGHANNSGGSGVYGQNDGTGYGVAGVATYAVAGGTGLLGDEYSPTGVGVVTDSSGGGTALNVNGKATFSNSGVVTIAAGKSSLVVTLGGVTTASMVLATAQQSRAVYVKAAVPGAGSFTIRLTGNAPSGGLKVAYFVLS